MMRRLGSRRMGSEDYTVNIKVRIPFEIQKGLLSFSCYAEVGYSMKKNIMKMVGFCVTPENDNSPF
jgi:hypothetical protein